MQMPLNILYHVFGEDKLRMIAYPADFSGRLQPQLFEGSCCYQLISLKVQEANSTGPSWQSEEKEQLHVCYLQVAGPGLATTTLQDSLEQLGNFAAMSPGKVRLSCPC